MLPPSTMILKRIIATIWISKNVYLDVLGDETERCDPPELPSLRPEKDSEGLKERNPESVYLHVLHDETEGNDENTKAEDQIQNQGTEQQEKA